jgi:hypothetical protein
VLAMLAVVTLHALLLWAIERARTNRVDRSVELDRALILIPVRRASMPERAAESTPREDAAPDPRPLTPRPAPVTNAPVLIPPVTPTPPRAIDWRANAARSAQVLVERGLEEKYRSFGPRVQQPGEAPSPPSVFGEPPKHKAGDVDTIAGDPIVWLNERCYMELDKQVQSARDWVLANPGSFAPPQIRCEGGGSAPNGDMFEHIKKREEPPVPKAGTEMNPLPERKDETRDSGR